MFLKVLKAGQVLGYKILGSPNLRKSNSLLLLKTVSLKLKSTLFAYKNTFNVARHLLKNIFKTATRALLVRDNVLKIAFFTPRT